MGFKEGIAVIFAVGLAIKFLPMAIKGSPLIAAGGPMLLIVLFFYVLDAFLDKPTPGSSGYLPATLIQSVTSGKIAGLEAKTASRTLGIKERQLGLLQKSRPKQGIDFPAVAGSFRFRRR